MGLLLEDAPLVLTDAESTLSCAYIGCRETPTVSVIWSCGETCPYCDRHLAWAREESETDNVSCDCPGVVDEALIRIMMVVPL